MYNILYILYIQYTIYVHQCDIFAPKQMSLNRIEIIACTQCSAEHLKDDKMTEQNEQIVDYLACSLRRSLLNNKLRLNEHAE